MGYAISGQKLLQLCNDSDLNNELVRAVLIFYPKITYRVPGKVFCRLNKATCSSVIVELRVTQFTLPANNTFFVAEKMRTSASARVPNPIRFRRHERVKKRTMMKK